MTKQLFVLEAAIVFVAALLALAVVNQNALGQSRQPEMFQTLNQTMTPATAPTTQPKVEIGFLLRESDGQAGKHNYSLFVPADYAAREKIPAIVFLHGIGEAGNDGVEPTTVGIGPYIARQKGNFPFIVIFPQCGFDWTAAQSEKIMLDALADARRTYPEIDPTQISLSGSSSGGKGTWALGARHPELFAALVPMGAFASNEDAPKLTGIPIWAFHNSQDFVVPVSGTRDMIQRIKQAGGDPRYTEFDAGGHNCWDVAYEAGELFRWLLQQRLKQ